MSYGSGLMSKQGARRPHLAKTTGEVGDLRRDINEELLPLAAVTVEEWADVAAAGAALLEAATATDDTQERVATLLQAGLDILDDAPRTVTFTVAGGTPADAPANANIAGKDVNGNAMTEVVALNQGGGLTSSVKCFKGTGLSVTYDIADGTDATVSIGIGAVIGLGQKIKTRAGFTGALAEIEAGTPKGVDALAGTYVDAATSPPNGSYAPGTAPNGTNDYALYYEYDPT